MREEKLPSARCCSCSQCLGCSQCAFMLKVFLPHSPSRLVLQAQQSDCCVIELITPAVEWIAHALESQTLQRARVSAVEGVPAPIFPLTRHCSRPTARFCLVCLPFKDHFQQPCSAATEGPTHSIGLPRATLLVLGSFPARSSSLPFPLCHSGPEGP